MVNSKIFFVIYVSIFISAFLRPINTVPSNELQIFNKHSSFSSQKTLDIQKPEPSHLIQYVMNSTFFKENASINTQMILSYLNTENEVIKNLYFNLYPNAFQQSSLIINNVTNGNIGLNYTFEGINNTLLKVDLSENINSGNRYNITMSFQTILPYEENRFGYQLQSQGSRHDLYALTHWYPLLAVFEEGAFVLQPYVFYGEGFYSDMSYYEVNLQTDKNLIVASGGEQVKHTEDTNSQTNQYKLYPAREISFVISPDFKVSTKTEAGVKILSYYFPEDSVRGLNAIDASIYSLNLFSDLFSPYPYTTMSVVEFLFSFGGMEYSGLVQIASNNYNETAKTVYDLEGTIAHEWSHDWNTYFVGNNPYKDPFMDEGLATYTMTVFFEKKYNIDIASNILSGYKANVEKNVEENGINEPIGMGMNYWETPGTKGYGITVYTKGALFFSFLRSYLGDETFFSFLKAYSTNFNYKTVNRSEFFALAREIAQEDLSWIEETFIDNSVYYKSFSLLKAERFNSNTDKKELLNFTLKQQSNYSVETKIPIEIQFEQGSEMFYVWMNGTTTDISLEITKEKGKIKSIEIDPNWVLFRNQGEILFLVDIKDPTGANTSNTIPTIDFIMITGILSTTIIGRKYKTKR